METRTRLMFVKAGIPEPRLNAAVRDADGEWLLTGDLVWDEKRVVAEYQGSTHRVSWPFVGREVVAVEACPPVQLTCRSVRHGRLPSRTVGAYIPTRTDSKDATAAGSPTSCTSAASRRPAM